MANVKSGNTFYVDSNGTLAGLMNVQISGVVITGGASAGSVMLQDGTTSANRLSLKIALGTTQFIDLSGAPIAAPNGVSIASLTNCVLTLILKGSGA